MKRYSPRPLTAYMRFYPARKVWIGFGKLKVLEDDPALWNLVWASDTACDKALDENQPAHEVPMWSKVIDLARETLSQKLGAVTIRELVSTRSLLELVALLKMHPDAQNLALYREYGKDWIAVLEFRAMHTKHFLPPPPPTHTPQRLQVIDIFSWRKQSKPE